VTLKLVSDYSQLTTIKSAFLHYELDELHEIKMNKEQGNEKEEGAFEHFVAFGRYYDCTLKYF